MIGVAFALALAGSPATVAVTVEPPERAGQGVDPALRTWLVLRFLEEGVAVTPDPEDAAAVVRLRGGREGSIRVEVGEQWAAIDAGESAVMRLELWHRARRAAELARADRAAHDSTWRRVRIVHDDDVSDDAEALVAQQLLASGFVLVPTGSAGGGTATVCVAYGDDAARFRVAGPTEQCSPGAMSIDYETLQRPGGADPLAAWVERSLLGAAGERTDDERAPLSADAGEADTVGVDRGPGLGPPRPSWRNPIGEARITVDGGVTVRGQADATMRSAVRLGMTPGPGGTIAVAVTPSQGGAVRAIDTVLAAGPDLSLRFRRDLGLDAMLALGAEIHSYRVESQRGGTVDVHAAMPVAFSWPIGRGARMHAVVEPGFSRARREHVVGSSVDWSRAPWSVRAALGVSYGWGIL